MTSATTIDELTDAQLQTEADEIFLAEMDGFLPTATDQDFEDALTQAVHEAAYGF